ncbi:MAG: DUF1684 domain-containing protein [Leucobacter sp.]
MAAVTEPYGAASLVLTHWLTGDVPCAVPGLPGRWASREGRIVGTGLVPGEWRSSSGEPLGDRVELRVEGVGGSSIAGGSRTAGGPSIAGDPDGVSEIFIGDRAVRAFERDGVLALRILDPAAENRVTLTGIESYEPDERWRVAAKFEPRAEHREIELFDGYQRTVETSGSLVFTLDGVERRLTGTLRPDAISVVFGDATNGVETYGFRFLTVPLPTAEGRTVIDFNRAYLPPCCFSDQFVCPLPTAENRLPVAIRAGERTVLRAE